MHILKLTSAIIILLLSPPAYAQQPAPDEFEATSEIADEQEDGTFITGFERPEREGPATATDKIVDRFMELNTNPDSSAGVDFEEYSAMVLQRATDRFKAMDVNQDEEVTPDEYREFWKTQKAQYYRLKR